MGRARGRHDTGRKPQQAPADLAFSVKPDSPEGREIGESELLEGHPLPGGLNHVSNAPTVHHKPEVGQPLPYFRGDMAHGVPPEIVGVRDRKSPDHDTRHVKYEEPVKRPDPVPVYVVESGASGRNVKVAITKNFQAPAIGAEPAPICEEDRARISVKVLNEDSNHSARIGQLSDMAVDLANNVIIGGSLLPKGMTSYLKLETQRPLYIMATDSGTPRISVIIETEVPR